MLGSCVAMCMSPYVKMLVPRKVKFNTRQMLQRLTRAKQALRAGGASDALITPKKS